MKYILLILVASTCISCENGNKTEPDTAYLDFIKGKLEAMNMERPIGSYNYPVYPGMKEWAELGSSQEMAEACQVPANVLEKMSAQAIIQALWEYPLLIDVFHRFEYQLDFETTFSQNNAYKELCTRQDAGVSLLERMEAFNPLVLEVNFGNGFFELLMAQGVFLSQLDAKGKVAACKIALQKDGLRQQSPGFADKNDRAITYLLLGKIMLSANYEPFVTETGSNEQLKLFLTSTSYVYMSEIYGNIPQIIVGYTLEFIQTSTI